MAGKVVVSTLNNDTGVLATQNGMTGIAKAWVNFNGTGTVAIRGSFNVSSITDNGTGDYTVNFTTAMPNANYAVTALARVSGNTLTLAQFKNGGSQTTTTFSLATYTSAPALVDASEVYFAAFSS
jgi:hypothetical protein